MARPLYGEDMTRSSLAQRRKLANALIAEATKYEASPHWATAVAKGLQGLVGGYQNAAADQAESDMNASIAGAIPDLTDVERIGLESGEMSVADVYKTRAASKIAEMRNQPDQAKYGLNPIWAKDANGNWQLYQGSDAGGAPQQMQFPDGVTPQPQMQFLNQGTQYQPVETRGGAPAGAPVPINNAQKAADTNAGNFAQDQRNQLGQAEVQLQATNELVNSIINDPALEYSVGQGVHRLRQFMHPQASIDFYNKLEALDGQAMLSQLPVLNAMKPVSNVDAQAATKAALAIDQYKRTSPERTVEALKTFQKLINDRMDVMRQQAGAPVPNQNMPLPMPEEEPWTDVPEYGARIRRKSP